MKNKDNAEERIRVELGSKEGRKDVKKKGRK